MQIESNNNQAAVSAREKTSMKLDIAATLLLSDHQVDSVSILPGVHYIAEMFNLETNAERKSPLYIKCLNFKMPVVLSAPDPTTLTIKSNAISKHVQLITVLNQSAEICAEFELERTPADYFTKRKQSSLRSEIVNREFKRTNDPAELYGKLFKIGNQYGSSFQTIEQFERSPAECFARIKPSTEVLEHTAREKYSVITMTTMLDGAIQTLAAAANRGQTYVLMSIDSVTVFQDITDRCLVDARMDQDSAENADQIQGSVSIYLPSGETVAVMTGVILKYLNNKPSVQQQKLPIAISATFTSEPILPAIEFWANNLQQAVEVEFAPYSQVFQQLLSPESLLGKNTAGLNLILIRPEDWILENNIPTHISDAKKIAILKNHRTHFITHGTEIAHLNTYETEYVYQEIFEDLAYLKNGISISDGDCIIDIGANIGLFTLFVHSQATNTTVYSYEPSPPVFKILEANAHIYGQNVHVFNMGVSDRKKMAEFTFYEKSSVFSSFSADEKDDAHAIRAVIENMVNNNAAMDEKQIDQLVDELIADRLTSTNYTCELVSLSDIIKDNNIQKIDLLKLDAEKSELDVLRGIEADDWSKIKQIVLEVHDREGPVIKEVKQILTDKGFNLQIEEEEFLQNSGLYNIFAIRTDANYPPTYSIEEKSEAKSTINEFQRSLQKNMEDFERALEAFSQHLAVPTIVSMCPPSDITAKSERRLRLLAQADKRLAASISSLNGIHYLSCNEVQLKYPVVKINDSDSDKLGQIPYTSEFFTSLGTSLYRRFNAVTQNPYKVIVLDCDNTLWRGVCGEDGPQGIILTDAYMYLQNFMKRQLDAGMLLCLCSKNAEEDVWAVFEQRTDMILQRSDIVAHKINWKRKSENISKLAAELNLGFESFVFLDDNPVECAEVRTMLPAVLTLMVPSDEVKVERFLTNIWAFDHLNITSEDRKRTTMYRENIEREEFKTTSDTLNDFLENLDLNINISPIEEKNVERVSQLTFRTNQFNLTTVRRSESELKQFYLSEDSGCLIAKVSDRFGDYGLVGTVLYSVAGNNLVVDTLLLSCRVLGRGVEHEIIVSLARLARDRDLSQIVLPYAPSAKNQPAVDFLDSIATDYKIESETSIIYVIPVEIAEAITYTPNSDAEYVQKALNQSSNASSQKPTDFPTSQSYVTQYFQNDESNFASVEQIHAEVLQRNSEKVNNTVSTHYVAPATKLQNILVSSWQTVLGLAKIGVNDNFFEIGGSSLKAVQFVASLKQDHDLEMGIVDLFSAPTIANLSLLLDNRRLGLNDVTETAKQSEARGSKRRNQLRSRRKR